MLVVYYSLSIISILCFILPFIPNQHWFFRAPEFGKVQNALIQSILVIIGLAFIGGTTFFYIILSILLLCIAIQVVQLFRYTPLYPTHRIHSNHKISRDISVVSANVYQFNTDYQKFIDLVYHQSADIVLTMESNMDWQNALTVLEKDYPYRHYVPLENTYGIHLYSKIEILEIQEHYFVSDDIPSIQAKMKTSDGYIFYFFGVHPPPPSPTEEDTSKERDGELLSIAKVVRNLKAPCIVVGDFNTVAWSKAATLFRKTSETIDPRIGRGLISTYHSKYFFLRFPIDQLYHSTDIFVRDIFAMQDFGSDHLPLYCRFYIDTIEDAQDEEVEDLEQGEMEEVNELIEEGKEEESDRPVIASE